MIDPRTADLINACFEGVGAIVIWRNVFALRRDRRVAGVDWRVTVFYSLWGVSNLVYYGALHQPFSLLACVRIAAGNITWVLLYLRLRKEESK